MEFLIAVVLLVALAWFVSGPLRRPPGEDDADARVEDPRVADLEAQKEAKYREIRDAELDHAQGKLSDEDWRRQDSGLRREAIAILKQLDELEAAHGD